MTSEPGSPTVIAFVSVMNTRSRSQAMPSASRTTTPHQSPQDAHTSAAIRARIGRASDHSYLSTAVLGAMDGCVTTFAVFAGGVGALSAEIIVMLGFANLLADGFSMAASNYLSVKSQRSHPARSLRQTA